MPDELKAIIKSDCLIAVLLTTFNRRAHTLACLESLYAQVLPPDTSLAVFMTDDASTDGTAAAVSQCYPNVHLLKGTGSLFWAGGMRHTWTAALEIDAKHYLLLNDDTTLEPLAITRLLAFYQLDRQPQPAICIGSTRDPEQDKIWYGGQKLFNRLKPKFHLIYSESEYLLCDMANANIMLVHKAVVQRIGTLSNQYTQSMADFDYTLRARNAGFKVVLVPGVLGYCRDDHGRNWKSSASSLRERLDYLRSPKGLSYKEYLVFIKLHFPLYLPFAFAKLWLKTLLPIIWDKLK